jgi:hypothetical protein
MNSIPELFERDEEFEKHVKDEKNWCLDAIYDTPPKAVIRLCNKRPGTKTVLEYFEVKSWRTLEFTDDKDGLIVTFTVPLNDVAGFFYRYTPTFHRKFVVDKLRELMNDVKLWKKESYGYSCKFPGVLLDHRLTGLELNDTVKKVMNEIGFKTGIFYLDSSYSDKGARGLIGIRWHREKPEVPEKPKACKCVIS